MNSNSSSYEISLNFTNNLLQTFLIDIFEKSGIKLTQQNIPISNCPYNSNLLHITYNKTNINYYLLFQTKTDFINNVITKQTLLFKILSKLIQMVTSPKDIILILYQINFDNDNYSLYQSLLKFKYFIETHLKIKTISIANSTELIDFIYNFNDCISTKDAKSKIKFYDYKPIKTTSLCDIKGISNKTFVKHLMCINGISEKKAVAIVEAFPTLPELYNVYLNNEQYTEQEKANVLADVEVLSNKSGNCKLGKALSEKIYKFYTCDNPNEII